MKYLIDTHVLLWSILETKKLPASVAEVLSDTKNEICFSSINLWEISIKVRLGKMNLVGLTTDDVVPSALKIGFLPIALLPEEAITQGRMAENTHFDPFDRMLIWQAISRGLVLVSGDREFERFKPDGLKLLWN
ncbi:MAG TPA: type II toxin-antitoxin system VapC family toxin [Pyrinomonadaceae bacterium]|nr:type II toxin-antitoxin system VapC family toxin [Pyrinomonadaceae bacterium]